MLAVTIDVSLLQVTRSFFYIGSIAGAGGDLGVDTEHCRARFLSHQSVQDGGEGSFATELQNMAPMNS